MMRDVDFMLAARPDDLVPKDRPLVYRYRSGVLRSRMIAALEKCAVTQGLTLAPQTPPLLPGFDQVGFLFKQLPLFRWPAGTSESFKAASLEHSLRLLSFSLDEPGIHLVENGSQVGRHALWKVIEQRALVIEEPQITRENLVPVLRYLLATTDLAPAPDLVEDRQFVRSFAHLVEERADLPTLMQAFDERVLLCTDSATGRYDDALFQRDVVERQGRRALLPHLRDLVAMRRERDLVDLLCGFDERRAERGWSAHRLVAELYKGAARLLEPVKDRYRSQAGLRARVAPHTVAEGSVLWGALLLAAEDTLTCAVREDRAGYRRGPDLVVPALAGLGRDFLARESEALAGDPLVGRWAAVARSLRRCGLDDVDDVLAKVRGDLVRELAKAIARQKHEKLAWVAHLEGGVKPASERRAAQAARDKDRDQRSRKPDGGSRPLIFIKPPVPLFRTFDTVIGREHAINGLRGHTHGRSHGHDLLLHGPAGIGKRTLAWSYAQMVLCTQPLANGAACGECASCRATEQGNSGCIEVDGARADIWDVTEQIVRRVQTNALLIERYVFVIRNADRYPPEAFDKLLNPMEDSGQASFVLLARDRRAVRLAGQSRCFDYRLRRLDRAQAERFVREALASRGMDCTEAVIALLVDAGEGVPRRLLEKCAIVAGTDTADLDHVRERLGLGWARELIASWPAIVEGAPSVLAALQQLSGTDRVERVRRIRAAIQWVSLPEGALGPQDRTVGDPAFLGLDRRVRTRLVADIAEQADREGTTTQFVWMRLAENWMADRLSPGWFSALANEPDTA